MLFSSRKFILPTLIGISFCVRLSDCQCEGVTNLDETCIPGQTSFSCVAGEVLTITSSAVYASSVPDPCVENSGLTCLVEEPATYLNITLQCNGQAICSFTPADSLPLPQNCINQGFAGGGQFLETFYYCGPANPPSTDICGGTISGQIIDLTSTSAPLAGLSSTPCYCTLTVPDDALIDVTVKTFSTTPSTVQNSSDCTQAVAVDGAGQSLKLCIQSQSSAVYNPTATSYNFTYFTTDTTVSSAFDVEISAAAGCLITLTCVPPTTTTTTTTPTTTTTTPTTTTTTPTTTTTTPTTTTTTPTTTTTTPTTTTTTPTTTTTTPTTTTTTPTTTTSTPTTTTTTPTTTSTTPTTTTSKSTTTTTTPTTTTTTTTPTTTITTPTTTITTPTTTTAKPTTTTTTPTTTTTTPTTKTTMPTTTTTTPTTTTKPTTPSCATTTNFFPFCVNGSLASFSCQPGQTMQITSAILYKYITGSCATQGGVSCPVETTINYAAVTSQCNAKQSCAFSVSTAFPIPANCSSFGGPFFIQIYYTCHPVSSSCPTTIKPTTAVTTPAPKPCSYVENFTIACLTGPGASPNTFSILCPAGYGLMILNSTLYKSLIGNCLSFGGSSCTIDQTINYANLSKKCNTLQSCSYSMYIPATLPSTCNGRNGPFTLDTFYRCYPAPVAPNIASICATNPCNGLKNFTVYCTSGNPNGPATISCPAGYGLIINNSTLYKSLTGFCPVFGGSSCTVDQTNNLKMLSTKCNTLPSCAYSVVIPATLPSSCTTPNVYKGDFFLETDYTCYPAPVVPNITAVCQAPPANPCSNTDNSTTFCTTGGPVAGPATITCPAGQTMTITNSTLYKSLGGNCTAKFGVSDSCVVDGSQNNASLATRCNSMQSCSYNLSIPLRPPVSCSTPTNYGGPYTLLTYFRCNPASCNPPPANPCANTKNFTVYCTSGNPSGPATISCPTGYGIVIYNSTLYKSLIDTCPKFGGSSCTVDQSNNFAMLSSTCNTTQSCNYNVVIPATLPSSCKTPNVYSGDYFLETFYSCYQASVVKNLATACGTTATTG